MHETRHGMINVQRTMFNVQQVEKTEGPVNIPFEPGPYGGSHEFPIRYKRRVLDSKREIT